MLLWESKIRVVGPGMTKSSCLFLYFKSVFEKIKIFYFILCFKLMFLVFSYWFDVLMLKIILKNKKTSLTCILAWKAIWKATATTLPNKPLVGKTYWIMSLNVWRVHLMMILPHLPPTNTHRVLLDKSCLNTYFS